MLDSRVLIAPDQSAEGTEIARAASVLDQPLVGHIRFRRNRQNRFGQPVGASHIDRGQDVGQLERSCYIP